MCTARGDADCVTTINEMWLFRNSIVVCVLNWPKFIFFFLYRQHIYIYIVTLVSTRRLYHTHTHWTVTKKKKKHGKSYCNNNNIVFFFLFIYNFVFTMIESGSCTRMTTTFYPSPPPPPQRALFDFAAAAAAAPCEHTGRYKLIRNSNWFAAADTRVCVCDYSSRFGGGTAPRPRRRGGEKGGKEENIQT